MTRREVGKKKKNAFNESRSGGSRPVRRHIRGRLSRFSHDSGVIPNFPPPPRVSEEQTAPPALTVNPAHIKVQVCFSYLNEGRGGASKAAGQSLCTSFVKGGKV